jgi:hypothetical protein
MHEPGSQERSLTAVLRALAEDASSQGASPDVEALLLAEVRALARARRRPPLKLYAIAAGLFVALAAPVWQLAERPRMAAPAARSADPAGDMATEFFPLAFINVPVTGGQLVRLEVPRVALASFGLAPEDSLEGSRPGMVQADVLVGEDGLARAVRFVRAGTAVPQQEYTP